MYVKIIIIFELDPHSPLNLGSPMSHVMFKKRQCALTLFSNFYFNVEKYLYPMSNFRNGYCHDA